MIKKCIALIAVIIIFYPLVVFAKDSSDEAWVSYMSGNYNKAIGVCQNYSGNSMPLDRGYYLMGLSYLKLGKTELAREKFRAVIENCPTSDIRDSVLLGLCDSYYLEGDFKLAECYYQGLLEDYPYTSNAAAVYLRLGNSQQKLCKLKQAQKSFDTVLKFYALSPEYEEALENVSKQVECFSIQLGAFSKEENADILLKELYSKGYQAFVEKGDSKGKTIYRVKVGKFSSREDADTEAKKLKKSGYSVRIVV